MIAVTVRFVVPQVPPMTVPLETAKIGCDALRVELHMTAEHRRVVPFANVAIASARRPL